MLRRYDTVLFNALGSHSDLRQTLEVPERLGLIAQIGSESQPSIIPRNGMTSRNARTATRVKRMAFSGLGSGA